TTSNQHSTSGSSALEDDETYLYRRDTSLTSFNIINYLFRSSSTTDNNSNNAYYSRLVELNIPDPLPLDVAVIDASILLYGTIFIRVPNKHRLNMLQHSIDIIKQSKEWMEKERKENYRRKILANVERKKAPNRLTNSKRLKTELTNQMVSLRNLIG
ncbi:unnamed protein product, partial [Rotaria sp. Silwood2]